MNDSTVSAESAGGHIRPRRLRRGALLREMFADVDLRLSQIVMPLFLKSGMGVRTEVTSMPGVFQMSPDVALQEVKEQTGRGISSFILFGVISSDQKDACGSIAVQEHNPVAQFLRLVSKNDIDALMIADLCYCEYTDHGHCGVLSDDLKITVENDATNVLLGEQAVFLAKCGADIIAPSGCMDGMVKAIRYGLDTESFHHIPILSYSVKYASNMYGPFRDAAEGAPQFGDRRGYQMDFRRSKEWRVEVDLDIAEGADIVMVKPAGPYLDVIARMRDVVNVPICAYQVSGEYSMLMAADRLGWLDIKRAALESLFSIRRAGADLIITYFAPRLPEWLRH
jgi:porphobilinogen synthase